MTQAANQGVYSPAERAENLINITGRLSEIMDAETRLLETRRPSELAPLVDEKSNLAAIYAREIRTIAANPGLMNGLSADISDRLKSVTRDFERRAAAQKSLLGRARRITEGVIKAIAEEVSKRNAAPAGYGDVGNQSGYAAPKPTTLALNEVV